MTIFVDSSALIAIITGAADADSLADQLEQEPDRLCSALSVWETVAGLCRSHTFTAPQAREYVRRFLDTGAFRFVAIGEREYDIATAAFAQYGIGHHRAALNMGDCFSYACAKVHDATLLYQGVDFMLTDLA